MKSLFVWFCIFLCLLAFPAVADMSKGHDLAKKKQTNFAATTVTTYDVYAGGIHAMNARLVLKRDADRYDVVLTAETQGFLKKVANWSGEFLSRGKITKGQTYPTIHKSASTWKGETESKTFAYDGKGRFVSYKVAEGGVDKTPKDIDLQLAKGTTDILSSTLRLMLSLPLQQECKGAELIFDGDRNYRLTYAETTPETLTKSDYNIYDGPSVSCTVEVKPEQGKWRKKPRGWLSIQEQGRQKGALPTVWFGRVPSKAKGVPDAYVPVKIRVKTDYGTLFMHLTSLKSW